MLLVARVSSRSLALVDDRGSAMPGPDSRFLVAVFAFLFESVRVGRVAGGEGGEGGPWARSVTPNLTTDPTRFARSQGLLPSTGEVSTFRSAMHQSKQIQPISWWTRHHQRCRSRH
jgi:hypothetical protein